MSLRDRLDTELKAAMRSNDAVRRDALRMVLAAVQRAEKEGKHTLADDEMLGLLSRELKVRRESVEAFRGGGREDLVAKEEAAIAVVSEFMPQPLSEAELKGLVEQGIAETGAISPREMGKVMGWLSPRTRGRADGKQVSQLVTQLLAARAAGS
ncbi:MAG TPA: GatB/YqeY domain-containing protein [Candidatus Limnocylindrales bacterium]|nr:GatB/YqeY domain-containing protein [Candidatus Limnocylindrales bacterium]